MKRTARLTKNLPPVCRLGLATRGNTHLRREDVEHAVECGLNYLNWCGKPDGLSEAVAALGKKRKDVVVAVQFQSRTAADAEEEFSWILDQLNTDYLDAATFYYVESESEWRQVIRPGGAWETLARHRESGALKMIGLTSHQRKLAAQWAQSKAPTIRAGDHSGDGQSSGSRESRGPYHLDMLMIRYNAAHRGAAQDVFPVTRKRRMPVVTFTGLRWRALLQRTPGDPEGFEPPSAAECYRFCLANPDVSVALAAPGNRNELDHALSLLDDWRPSDPAAYRALCEHGDRVREHAGVFW